MLELYLSLFKQKKLKLNQNKILATKYKIKLKQQNQTATQYYKPAINSVKTKNLKIKKFMP